MAFRPVRLLKNFLWDAWNFVGWRSNRRILVLESDDWGTVRMASKQAFDFLLKKGYPVNHCAYNCFDSLECNEDLEFLFEVLASVKDKNGNSAIITANNIVGNPDFDLIKASGYKEYFFEPFSDTLRRYPKHDKVLSLYQEGIRNRVFWPQFHGREHVNVRNWLAALQAEDRSLFDAFELRMFSLNAPSSRLGKNQLMDSFNTSADLGETISDGLQLFADLWGYKSESFISPCYIWNGCHEEILRQHNVFFIQGTPIHLRPASTKNRAARAYHYQGQTNSQGQRYIIRNAFFEPSTNPAADWVDLCLERIEGAFRWNSPAVISSHRLNFSGFMVPANRDRNLQLLRTLLNRVIRRWPDVEFMTSDELGRIMNADN